MSPPKARLVRYLRARVRHFRRQLEDLAAREALEVDDPGWVGEGPARQARAAISGAVDELELLLSLLLRE